MAGTATNRSEGEREMRNSSEFNASADIYGDDAYAGEEAEGQSDPQSTTVFGDEKTPDEYQQVNAIAKGDTRKINIIRFLTVSIILCVGAALSACTFIVLTKLNEQSTKDSFTLFAGSIEENWKFRIATIFFANRALSRSITTSAFASTGNGNAKIPYFSIPAWEAKAYESRVQAGFETVTYAPIVAQTSRWLNFTQESRGWLDESKFIYDELHPGSNRSKEPPTPPLPDVVWDYDETKMDGSLVEHNGAGIMAISLHVSPPPLPTVGIYQNINFFSNPDYKAVSNAGVKLKDAVFSQFSTLLDDNINQLIGMTQHQKAHSHDKDVYLVPHSVAAQPVFRGLAQEAHDVVGYIYSVVAWDRYLQKLLPNGVVGIVVVLKNSCGQAVTFGLEGEEAVILASEDIHDPTYDSQKVTVDFTENYLDPTMTSQVGGHCQVFLEVYSSEDFEESHASALPAAMTVLVACLFLIMAAFFFVYDWFVERRNRKVVEVAARTNAIVSNLFPTAVKDRLMEEQLRKSKIRRSQKHATSYANTMKSFLYNREEATARTSLDGWRKTPPIADFYPQTTILFSDLAGFTAWSSSREPTQVFTLLETLYHEFDAIAKRRKIFKVETIGDCYVAVCGLPDPRQDHAVAMCKFAKEAMEATWLLVKTLTTTLGPDTNDLTMRMGIHSGPITAGVLRGDKGRFQLFGDTMNTASRMESNGLRSRIQISQQTADLLTEAKRTNWFKPREDKITAKGKGELQTYWLLLNDTDETASNQSGSTNPQTDELEGRKFRASIAAAMTARREQNLRLIQWNVELLSPLLRNIVAHRNEHRDKKNTGWKEDTPKDEWSMAFEEVSGAISFGSCHGPGPEKAQPDSAELSPEVKEQLTSYVSNIAALYNDNPFHNFDRASHATMSVHKLLAQIVATGKGGDKRGVERSATWLIDVARAVGDPLTQFACVLSGVILDVDHPGVPNAQLIKEESEVALRYNGRSVSQRHSIDKAWGLLLKDEYNELRRAIYSNEKEKKQLRSVLINAVMATDIIDPELKKERNARWDKAFIESSESGTEEARNLMATVVIEQLMQVSDVSHTMQHWHVYEKWGAKLFTELYQAFREGRAERNPADFWYNSEIGFFESFVIPLAKKLKDCEVFGVTSDEYLIYAEQNLVEWKLKGQQIVVEMTRKAAK